MRERNSRGRVHRALAACVLAGMALAVGEAAAQTVTAPNYAKLSRNSSALIFSSLANGDEFGYGIADIGDLNGDGFSELAIGTPGDDDTSSSGNDRGAMHTLVMVPGGAPAVVLKASETAGGGIAGLTAGAMLGRSVAPLGDLDGDGYPDVAIGVPADDTGGTDRGAVYVAFLQDSSSVVKSTIKIAHGLNGFSSGLLDDGDQFGNDVDAMGDMDGNGAVDLVVGAPYDDDDGSNRGAAYILFMNTDGTVASHQKISSANAYFDVWEDSYSVSRWRDEDWFGFSVANIGDLDGDGDNDLVAGVPNEYDSFELAPRGGFWIIYLHPDGTVQSHQKHSDEHETGGITYPSNGKVGFSLAGIGDIDLDGVPDLAVGAPDQNGFIGNVYIALMRANGLVRTSQQISEDIGGFDGGIVNSDDFGRQVALVDDYDGDGRSDLAVSAYGNNATDGYTGVVHLLAMESTRSPSESAASIWTPGKLMYPSVAVDDEGNDDNNGFGLRQWLAYGNGVWMASVEILGTVLETDGSSDQDIAVSRSLDGGHTWSNPVAIHADYATDGSTNDFRPTLQYNEGTSKWYCLWSKQGNLKFAWSADDGVTWSTPTNANSTYTASDIPGMATDGSGTWLVAQNTYDLPPGPGGNLVMNRSTDDGATWSHAAVVSTLPGTDRYLDVDFLGGTTWLCSWTILDGSVEQIHNSISTDDGLTWSAPTPVTTSGAYDSYTLADGLGNIVLAHPTTGSPSSIHVRRSTDNAATWSSPTILHTGGAGVRLATDGAGTFYAVWYTTGITDFEVMYSVSTDGGATWSASSHVNDWHNKDVQKDGEPIVASDGAGKWICAWRAAGSLIDGYQTSYDYDIAYAMTDLVAPTAVASLDGASPTSADTVRFLVDFDDVVAPTFTTADVTVDGLSGTVSLSGPYIGEIYELEIALADPDADGTVGFTIGTDVEDGNGNAFGGLTSSTFTIDNTGPSSSASVAASTLVGTSIDVDFSASDAAGVATTALHVRAPGSGSFADTGLSLTGTSGTFNYVAGTSGLHEFQTVAVDVLGNAEAVGAAEDSIVVNVTPNSPVTLGVAAGSGVALEFPMESAGATLSVVFANVASPGTLAVERNEGNAAPTGVDPTGVANEWWTISAGGGLAFDQATLTIVYDEGQLAMLEGDLDQAWREDGSMNVTTFPLAVDTGADTATIVGVTGFSSWYVGSSLGLPVQVDSFGVE